MKVNKLGAFVAVMVIIIGGSIFAKALGLFATESEKQAALIKTGEFAGSADPNDIRGSYSFTDIEENFGVAPSLLAEAFGIEGTEQEIAEYQCKQLEEKYADSPEEVGTSSVRLFVAFLKGLPVELGPFLPESAIKVILENNEALDSERRTYLADHTIPSSESISQPQEQEPAPPPEESEQPAVKSASEQAAQKKTDVATSAVQSPPAVTTSGKTQEAPVTQAVPVQEKATDSEPSQAEGAIETTPSTQNDVQNTAEEHETQKEAGTVKGSTTIYDLISWGVKREEIGPAVGIELPSDNGAKLKDLITAAGLSFEDAKVILQKLVDEAK